jgi:SAM-dependent methyltransferase
MKRVLDACCGSRMFWADKKNADVVFGDLRNESHVLCDGRALTINPDVQFDFTNLPFADNSFKLVVFDPPHLHAIGEKSWMRAKYGKLSESWQDDLRKGFSECFRVLCDDGVLVFKWNETQIKVRQVLELSEIPPLFGNLSGGRKGHTHWYVFMNSK